MLIPIMLGVRKVLQLGCVDLTKFSVDRQTVVSTKLVIINAVIFSFSVILKNVNATSQQSCERTI